MSFTCPKCGRTSYHPVDEAEGYCGACHEFTGAHPHRTTGDDELVYAIEEEDTEP